MEKSEPSGSLTTRTLAMPANTNPDGDIFGGWILSQMDIASGITAHQRASGRVVTVAVDSMEFHRPVVVGDVVSCYTEIKKTGTTSLTIHVEAWAEQRNAGYLIKVTEGKFTFVAIDKNRVPRTLPSE